MDNNNTLHQVAKGAGLLFIGTFFVYIIKFIYRIIVSRYLGPADYGLLSLGDGIFNIISLIAMLGLSSGGAVKFISHYLGEKRLEKVKGTILTTFKITIPFSILVAGITIVFSQYIAIGIFNKKALIPIIVIFSVAIPFYVFANLCANIFIAFGKIKYRNYLTALTRPITSIILVSLIIILKGNVFHIAMAFLISHILPSFLGSYLLEFKTFSVIKSKIKAKYNLKEVLTFSLPIFLSGFFLAMMGWIDSFFLGALKTISDVGIYNVALSLVSTLIIFISAFGKIFFPISSQLYAQKKYSQINKTYSSISRWLFMLSFPVFLIILFMSKEILKIVFGPAYESGTIVLQILIFAYFIKAIMGPAPEALMTLNKTKLLFYINSGVAILNMIFNYLLIPWLGIAGAAIATSIAVVLRDGIIFIIVKKELKFKFNINIYLKYFFSGILPILGVYFLSKNISINLITLIILVVIYSIFYLILLRLFSSFVHDDLSIVEMIEGKIKINLSFVKRFMGVKK
jgi:O-antigen/teichoic acid export membrane protein